MNQEHHNNTTYHTPREALKVLFGYDSFRPGQQEVIESILSGRDTFAVMPTGAGKSVCYQIPAMLLPGITLVISPLISLMQDQVSTLNAAGIPAAAINSALSEKNYFDTLWNAAQGQYKILYVAPERLETDSFLNLTRNVHISMVTVDEAHCISQWGQDFRPSYRKIVEFVETLETKPILSAFTATATKTVCRDVIRILGLRRPFVLVAGFNRENLFFRVERPKDKDAYIFDHIGRHPGDSGIIYCATRKNVDKLYELLCDRGIPAARYHAGMNQAERKRMQDDFVYDRIGVIVATNAFGMGIDKSNVRFVIHYNMPQSMENYYQEAGRAGRDGVDAQCILLFSPQDIVIDRFLLEHKEMTDLDPQDRQIVREQDAYRLRRMEGYCYTTECLRNYILTYFGEAPEEPCGDCGNCLRDFETLDMTEAAKKIISCVYEARGRYGRTIIIDTVAGAKTARLEEIGALQYKSYGTLAKINRKLLRRLADQLVIAGYLQVGDYQVLRLGNIDPLRDPKTRVMVPITEEDKIPGKNTGTRKTAKGAELLTESELALFERFRELRREIAAEEDVPPYIVFSDKSLIDMAAKLPMSDSEMLEVSGVGRHKLDKYGKRFLALAVQALEEDPELARSRKMPTQPKEAGEKPRRKKKPGKEEFSLLPEEADKYEYSDYLYINQIRDELNRICTRDNVKKLPATRLTEILLAEELIREITDEGIYGKEPTEKGIQLGIRVIENVSEKGNTYTLLQYPREVQRLLLEHYVRG